MLTHEDDRDLAQVGYAPDRVAKLETVAFFHDDVAHDRVRLALTDGSERGAGSPGGLDAESSGLEPPREELELGRVVVDDEDPAPEAGESVCRLLHACVHSTQPLRPAAPARLSPAADDDPLRDSFRLLHRAGTWL
jgi:hypothetical protein